jgi:hypothetical protein
MDWQTDLWLDQLFGNYRPSWLIIKYKYNINEGHSRWFLSNCFNDGKELVEYDIFRFPIKDELTDRLANELIICQLQAKVAISNGWINWQTCDKT